MTDDLHPDAQVSFSVRDLLKDIKDSQTAGFVRVEKSLESKADKADLIRMERRLENHGERIATIEQERRDAEVADRTEREVASQWSLKQKVWAGLGTFAMVTATIIGPYLGAHIL